MAQRHPRSLAHGLVVLAAAALALTGCARGPEPGVPPIPMSSTTETARAAAPSTPAGPGPSFSPCAGGLECASVPVPVDYANPTGPGAANPAPGPRSG